MKNNLVGHVNIRDTFLNLFIQHKLHHAFIFHGNKGVGKFTYAKYFSHILSSYTIDNIPNNIDELQIDDKIKHLIDTNAYSNVLIIQPLLDEKSKTNKENIGIDEIRKINDFLKLTNSHNRYRIIIIDSINNLNTPAANALLKNLEDPPLNTIFFLISHNIKQIMDTIVSRCLYFKFNKLNHQELNALCSLYGVHMDDTHGQNYFNLADGSFSRVLFLNNPENIKIYNQLLDLLNSRASFGQINEFVNHVKSTNYQDWDFLLDAIYNHILHNYNQSYANEELIASIVKYKKLYNKLYLDKSTILIDTLLRVNKL